MMISTGTVAESVVYSYLNVLICFSLETGCLSFSDVCFNLTYHVQHMLRHDNPFNLKKCQKMFIVFSNI